MADYNVTCPDFRFCEIKHRYSSPCEIWDCDACWWHYDNCTKTPEAPSDHCPYIKKCYELPRPQSHTTTVVISVVTALSLLIIGARYLYQRYRRSQQDLADAEGQQEEGDERVPLLQRCRNLLSRDRSSDEDGTSTFRRFRAVIFGHRANAAPPEVPQLDQQVAPGDNRQGFEPSAPPAPAGPPARAPPPYEAINRDPIIRGGSLRNENYRGHEQGGTPPSPSPPQFDGGPLVEMRQIRRNSHSRSPRRLDEISLSQSLH